MNAFDVIVIGGGPAGCYAALAAAVNGCSVALFEEHPVIGWPRHDPGWLMESDFTDSIIGTTGKVIPWSRVKAYNVCDAASGQLIETNSRAGYLVRRDLLEKEVAALAVKAGARLYLKTRVTNLVRGGRNAGTVETNSSVMPRAEAKIVICADGIRSAAHGFAATEGLCESMKPQGGVSYVLAGAAISPGVIEHFLSTDPLLNYRTFFTHGDGLSYLGLPTASAFQDIKAREDNEVSRKFKHAFPVEISGYARTSGRKYASYFETMVRGNVIFVGDASGGAGNIHGMIQGQFAATVAASALKEKEITEQRLAEYAALVRNTLGKAPFFYFSAREDFGTFGNWFREVEAATKGIKAVELSQVA